MSENCYKVKAAVVVAEGSALVGIYWGVEGRLTTDTPESI